MKIGLCGDSFCDDIGFQNWEENDGPQGPGQSFDETVGEDGLTYSWPLLLQKHYNAEIECFTQGGGCLFHAYDALTKDLTKDKRGLKYFLNKLIDSPNEDNWYQFKQRHAYQSIESVRPNKRYPFEDLDCIIFCITEPARIANYQRRPLTYNSAFRIDETNAVNEEREAIQKLRLAAQTYYNDLFCEEFHKAAHIGILMQLNMLMQEHKKKCIFFGSFSDSFCSGTHQANVFNEHSIKHGTVFSDDILSIIKSGPIGNAPLMNISFDEPGGKCIDWTDRRQNHFNNANNHNMFNLLKDIIDTDNFESRMINMKDYFKYS